VLAYGYETGVLSKLYKTLIRPVLAYGSENGVLSKLYKTLIRPVLAYGSETGVLPKSDEAILGVFERKILRAILGPTNDNGEWRIKYNDDLYTLYKENDRVTYIKINQLRWAGHVIRLEGQSPTRRVLTAVCNHPTHSAALHVFLSGYHVIVIGGTVI
jgi:hypothetical protein